MRNKKKLCAGILMLLLLTGCSSQEVLQEVPQTIVLPESQIDTMPVQETAAAENDNTESFSLLEEGGSRFAYESLDAQEQIWYQEIEQAIGSMDDTIKLSTEPLEQGMDEQDIDKVFQCVLIDHPEIFYTTGYTYTKYSRGEKTVGIDFAGTYDQTKEEAVARAEAIRSVTAEWLSGMEEAASEYDKVKAVYEAVIFSTTQEQLRSVIHIFSRPLCAHIAFTAIISFFASEDSLELLSRKSWCIFFGKQHISVRCRGKCHYF